jgi:hypothetical protein
MVLERYQERLPYQHVVTHPLELPVQLHLHGWFVSVWRVVCDVQFRDV